MRELMRGETAATQGRDPAWRLHHHNQTVWREVFALCEEARRSLDLEQYIFAAEGVGRRLLDLLARQARRGIAVRVLADGVGSRGLARSEGGRALIRAGGEIALYNGLAEAARRPFRSLPRLHRKTVLADGRSLMLGGSCYIDRMSDWRDTMIRIDGPVPPAVSASFQTAWAAARRAPAPAPTPTPGARLWPGGRWSYALSGPQAEAAPGLGETLLARIAGARRAVTLTTPYLIPDRRLRRALLAARKAGARVRILMPARSDHPPLDLVGRRFARALARRGVEVHGYAPTMLHAKIALVDGEWGGVSSFNLDVFSLRLNLENGVASRSPAFCEALAERLERDFAAASS
jgi:cardiolipin synthase